jgi:hypothetical protein
VRRLWKLPRHPHARRLQPFVQGHEVHTQCVQVMEVLRRDVILVVYPPRRARPPPLPLDGRWYRLNTHYALWNHLYVFLVTSEVAAISLFEPFILF